MRITIIVIATFITMSILKKTLFLLIGWCAFITAAFATDYQSLTDDIRQRLDKTSQFYQQQQIDEARTEVQMAYFEVFENLEGPIRINISAQKATRWKPRLAKFAK